MPILGSFAGISSKAYGLTSNLVGDYFFIAKADAPTGAVASLDFTSIPQNYTHLEIRTHLANTTATGQLYARFNSDAGATQYCHAASYYEGTNNSTETSTGTNYARFGTQGVAPASMSMSVTQIQNYTNTNIYKNYTSFSNRGGNNELKIVAGIWKSGSAITTISLIPATNNFAQYSVAYLYGIK